mgnify:CR=1 FL=1
MIQEIKIKNFLSFKDEVCFSFEATNDKFAEESQVVTINENTRLLRFAIIYGYNASGKSNLLRALDFLLYFWSFKPKDLDSGTGVIPFKLDKTSADVPSCFEMVFLYEIQNIVTNWNWTSTKYIWKSYHIIRPPNL